MLMYAVFVTIVYFKVFLYMGDVFWDIGISVSPHPK